MMKKIQCEDRKQDSSFSSQTNQEIVIEEGRTDELKNKEKGIGEERSQDSKEEEEQEGEEIAQYENKIEQNIDHQVATNTLERRRLSGRPRILRTGKVERPKKYNTVNNVEDSGNEYSEAGEISCQDALNSENE